MQKSLVIGESGGSKTDWVLLDKKGQVTRFSGDSLHPKNWLDFDFYKLQKEFATANVHPEDCDLVFYGAGLNSLVKQDEFRLLIKDFSFKDIKIDGDLLAAGLATLGKLNGYVAILGTGSVLIEFKNEKVVNHFGGLGREMGDEGAGFYFGKMVLQAYQNDRLSQIQKSVLLSVLSKKEEVFLKKGSVFEEMCLKMAFLLSDHKFEFESFHRNNFQLFFDKYVQITMNTTIHFVGSYAYFHESILRQVCNEKGYHPGMIIARPLSNLITHYQKELI